MTNGLNNAPCSPEEAEEVQVALRRLARNRPEESARLRSHRWSQLWPRWPPGRLLPNNAALMCLDVFTPRSYRAGFQNLGQFYRQFGLLVQTRKLPFKGPVALNNCTSSVGWFTVYYDLGEFFSFHPISHFFFKHTSFTHAINVERALKVIRCLAQGHFGDALGVNLLPVLCTR